MIILQNHFLWRSYWHRLRVTQPRIAMMEAESSAGAAVFSNGVQLRIDYGRWTALYLNEQELHSTPNPV